MQVLRATVLPGIPGLDRLEKGDDPQSQTFYTDRFKEEIGPLLRADEFGLQAFRRACWPD